MKKSLVALALFGAFATVAQAQSSVVVYGLLDAGFQHTKIAAAGAKQNTIGVSDNNRLGFKGVEDLGNGLKALFQLEMRFSPDTGTVESGNRPLFQGESRVGLQGDFGTVRIGRGLTAFQASVTAFEPWMGLGNGGAGFNGVLQNAGFNADPLNGTSSASNSKTRISNAVFYNSPVIGGFQANVSVGTKETASLTTGTPPVAVPATTVPFSASATYNMGIVGAMVAAERNAVEDKLWSIAASVKPVADLKLMASFQKQNAASPTALTGGRDQKAWIVGANYTMGAGKILAGYGQMTPDVGTKTKKASVGYQYSLSKRTYAYADVSNTKAAPVNGETSNLYYGVGIHHNF